MYFENPVGRIMEHPDEYAVIQYHAGERALDCLQAFLRHTGQLLRLHGWNRLLGDQRLMSPYTPEESQWIVEYWLAHQNQGQAVYGAVILPEDEFARLSVNQVMQEAQAAALTYRLFDNEAAAVAWLKQVPAA
ncbi:hypothetical protein PK28_10215 [Hymenobacter sp. DG25B]|nr:hypothetical protein PK28_10215 [Hymenobacter sp. DG25B]